MKPIIQLNHADLGYSKKPILHDVSCTIQLGDQVGIVGQNGSGKTTFLRSILGSLKPLKGTLQIDRTQRFAYVPQMDHLNVTLPLTVRETVLLAKRAKNIFGKISQDDEQSAEHSIKKVGLEHIQHLLIREISGGQRQRTLLAQALSQKPNVILLDEPTRGLDIVAEQDFLSLIQQLREEQNMTLLLVTHALQIPLNYTQKIFIMHRGSLISTTPNELIQTKKLEEIYGVPFIHNEQNGTKWVFPLKGVK